MGKKYIIEIPEDKIEDFVGSTHFLMPYMMAGHIGHHDTGLPIEPYIKPDLEQVRKEAYEHGYYIGYSKYLNRSYEDGLKDAWEAVGKIYNMCSDVRHKIFKENLIRKILSIYSASEVIEKIRQYEQEQEEIKVGDEVEWNGDRYVVTYIDVDETYVDVIDCSCGSVCDRLAIKGITKTGRHFPEIASVLQKMRGEQ